MSNASVIKLAEVKTPGVLKEKTHVELSFRPDFDLQFNSIAAPLSCRYLLTLHVIKSSEYCPNYKLYLQFGETDKKADAVLISPLSFYGVHQVLSQRSEGMDIKIKLTQTLTQVLVPLLINYQAIRLIFIPQTDERHYLAFSSLSLSAIQS